MRSSEGTSLSVSSQTQHLLCKNLTQKQKRNHNHYNYVEVPRFLTSVCM